MELLVIQEQYSMLCTKQRLEIQLTTMQLSKIFCFTHRLLSNTSIVGLNLKIGCFSMTFTKVFIVKHIYVQEERMNYDMKAKYQPITH